MHVASERFNFLWSEHVLSFLSSNFVLQILKMNHNLLNELDEEEEQLVAIALALVTSGKKTQTNVINAKRESLGEFHHLFPQLLSEEDRFVMYFRMTKEEFYNLLHIIKPAITKSNTQLRKCIPAEERLAVCLR